MAPTGAVIRIERTATGCHFNGIYLLGDGCPAAVLRVITRICAVKEQTIREGLIQDGGHAIV